jgi:hypothetical protein
MPTRLGLPRNSGAPPKLGIRGRTKFPGDVGIDGVLGLSLSRMEWRNAIALSH